MMPEDASSATGNNAARVAASQQIADFLVKAEEVRLPDGPTRAWFRSVLDALPAAVYTTDTAGRITYYNQAAAELAGRRPVLGQDQWSVTWRLYKADGTPMPHECCAMATALRENRAVRGIEAILERPDGTRLPFLPFPTPLRDADGKLIGAVNVLLDISERKDGDNARAYLAAIVESSTDAIVSKNLDGIVTSWNRGAETIFGYTAEEMVGRPIALLFPPDRLSEEDLILSRLRRGEPIEHFETVRRCKDGREIDVSVSISPVRDRSGRIIGAVKIARDITQRKCAEVLLRDLNENLERRVAERTLELADANRRLMAEMAIRDQSEAALHQAQKMEAIGQLAFGVAHDFNNLLAVISGNLELLEMRFADPELRRLAGAATRAAQHGARLNQQMLAFSRKQRLTPRPVDVNRLVLDLKDLLSRTLGGTIEVVTALGVDLWSAMVDPNQLELVLLNLAINARDAMPLGGRLTIATRNVAEGTDGEPGLSRGDYVAVAVADTGTGMTPDVMARACEPFFTTKEAGKGSGLGLAQVYGVLTQSGGGLRIDSVPGEGTTITLYLPRSRAVPAQAAADERATARRRPSGQRCALVVDDHEDVREVIAAYLDRLGYAVVEAANARVAVELMRTDSNGIDLLITDFAMPGMSGLELVRAARASRPGLPVLVVTGYAETADIAADGAHMTVLMKPFRMEALAAAVEDAFRVAPWPADASAAGVIDGVRPRAAIPGTDIANAPPGRLAKR